MDAYAQPLADHGTFSLERALASAIHFAEEGFPVGKRVAEEWEFVVPKLRDNAAAFTNLLYDDAAPAPGEVVRFGALARTLRTIAADGPDAFYRGPLAEATVGSHPVCCGHYKLGKG